MKTSHFETAVVKVIRGEKEWSILKNFGLNIRIEGMKWILPPSQYSPVYPKTEDFAIGILNLYSNKEKLQIWASFLLAASSIIDFEALETSCHGELLLNSLWELSFGETLNEEIIQAVKSIVSKAQ